MFIFVHIKYRIIICQCVGKHSQSIAHYVNLIYKYGVIHLTGYINVLHIIAESFIKTFKNKKYIILLAVSLSIILRQLTNV